MIGMSIDVTVRDRASPVVAAVGDALKPENVGPLIGESVSSTIRENFMDLDETYPNRLGGERTHYYAQAADKTDWTQDEPDVVTVHIKQVGIAIRYFGGTIEAGKGTSCETGKATKYLTIPATSEAYGKRACDIPDLVLLWGKNGPYALGRVLDKLQATQDGRRGASAQDREVVYFLKKSVTIQPDDKILPEPGVIGGNLRRDLTGYLRDIVQVAKDQAEEQSVESGVLAGLSRASSSARNIHLGGNS